MRIEIQWNSLFPLSMPYVTTLQYREIFWQNGSLLYGSDTAKQEFFMRLQLRLQSLHKHDFISNQLLFYCWLTQQHYNFSVSFSFKLHTVWMIKALSVLACLSAELKTKHQCRLNPFRTKTPKYLFPRENKSLLYHQIGNIFSLFSLQISKTWCFV